MQEIGSNWLIGHLKITSSVCICMMAACLYMLARDRLAASQQG